MGCHFLAMLMPPEFTNHCWRRTCPASAWGALPSEKPGPGVAAVTETQSLKMVYPFFTSAVESCGTFMKRMARWWAGSGASRKPGSSCAAVRGGGNVRRASTLGITFTAQVCTDVSIFVCYEISGWVGEITHVCDFGHLQSTSILSRAPNTAQSSVPVFFDACLNTPS